jgi:hypothetical protein
MLSMWVAALVVRVSLRRLRRGTRQLARRGNSTGMSRCSRSGLRDNKCSRWGELRGVTHSGQFLGPEVEGGEVGKYPCLAVGKQAKFGRDGYRILCAFWIEKRDLFESIVMMQSVHREYP